MDGGSIACIRAPARISGRAGSDLAGHLWPVALAELG
jgi:hypothetical protein